MPIQTLSPKISSGSMLGQAVGQGLQSGIQQGFEQQRQQRMQQQQKSLLNQAFTEAQQVYANPNLSPEEKQIGLYKALHRNPEVAKALVDQQLKQQQIQSASNKPQGGITGQPIPPNVSNAIAEVIKNNPKATSDELGVLMGEKGIPTVFSNPYIENRRRTQEQVEKTKEGRRESLRKETLPFRTKYAEKSSAAQKGIENKEQLIRLIKSGDINDPTYAAIAEALPLNLGKRLLSPETVEYKAGLVEEFGDLRNIFQGQTRIKEIDLLENKIADLYLTDEQKLAVMNSRLRALKADIIRAEAASELEDREDLGVLQFEKEVEKRSKPKLEALFNSIIDEQKSIFENAEKRKSLTLDPNDPDDLVILNQILKEARGDKSKARKIASEKGYKF
jgi:hypothetical protein